MPDDLDNLIRAAMKTLDEQVPSGYFEALPNQTLARLEGSMQQGSSGTTTQARDKVAPPPVAAFEPDTAPVAKPPSHDPDERDEDSGLHDIRNLAQSTKQRLSVRRITQSPPIAEDVLASSSGSFKNIALPQPARMVSLPEVEELPSKQEIAAAEKAAKKAAKEKKAGAKAEPVAAPVLAEAAAPAAAVETRRAFSLPSQQRKKSKAPLIALVGTGLAAAAGYVIFLQVNKNADDTATTNASMQAAPAAEPQPAGGAAAAAVPTPPPAEPVVEAALPETAAADAAAEAQIAADDVEAKAAEDKNEKADAKTTRRAKPAKGKAKVDKEEPKETKPEVKTEPKDAAKEKKAATGDEGEPSFDALLKEAGVVEKKEAKPKLDKKSLTGDDFKKGIAAVGPKAKGCYKGTQGTAMVKLTIAPSGKVTKVSVTGDFAGKPEGTCVAAAIKSATFPPWDGGPMSFTYSVLLAD